MKVAIVKSRIYKGGVSQVLTCIIETLNRQGIKPDIITLKSHINESTLQNDYGAKLSFVIKEIFTDIRMPYEWHFLYFNLVSRPYLKKYDLIIDSNNTSFLSQNKIPVINYIHYPRKDRVISNLFSIHLPEGKKKSPLDIKNDLFFIAKFIFQFDKKRKNNEKIICNSNFTASVYHELYHEDFNNIDVIYPPIQLSQDKVYDKIKNTVVTLGRFSNEKRQLEQIEIAKQLPQLNFKIIGFTGDDKYFKKCRKKIENEKIENVTLLPNISFIEIEKHLNESTFFLHNVRMEPFGISTIQAISKGCIPIVHNSGGSKEIVQSDKLLFNSVDECIKIFSNLNEESINLLNAEFKNRDLSIYSKENFIQKFGEILNGCFK